MRFVAAALAAVLLPCAASAVEIRVLSGGAVKSAFTAATQAYAALGGDAVDAQFAPAGEMRQRLAAGEAFDVVVMPSENLAEQEKAGKLDMATRRDLGAVAIGAAVKE